jgi:hypothetical protein
MPLALVRDAGPGGGLLTSQDEAGHGQASDSGRLPEAEDRQCGPYLPGRVAELPEDGAHIGASRKEVPALVDPDGLLRALLFLRHWPDGILIHASLASLRREFSFPRRAIVGLAAATPRLSVT